MVWLSREMIAEIQSVADTYMARERERIKRANARRRPAKDSTDMQADAPRRPMTYDVNGAVQTLEGRYFWPLEPNHPGNRYRVVDTAHCLAGQRRWGGWCHDPITHRPLHYSVAQHAVLTSILAERHAAMICPDVDWSNHASPALYGLHHDDSEAYLVDIPRPIKPAMGDYYAIEAALMDRMLVEFSVPVSPAIKHVVKTIDNWMIFLERDVLMGAPEAAYSNESDHPGGLMHDYFPDFRPWEAPEAKARFIERHYELSHARIPERF